MGSYFLCHYEECVQMVCLKYQGRRFFFKLNDSCCYDINRGLLNEHFISITLSILTVRELLEYLVSIGNTSCASSWVWATIFFQKWVHCLVLSIFWQREAALSDVVLSPHLVLICFTDHLWWWPSLTANFFLCVLLHGVVGKKRMPFKPNYNHICKILFLFNKI